MASIVNGARARLTGGRTSRIGQQQNQPRRIHPIQGAPKPPVVGTRVSPGTVPARNRTSRKPITPTRKLTIQAPIPAFTPGVLDAEGTQALNDLNTRYKAATGLGPDGKPVAGAIGSIQRGYDDLMNQIKLQQQDTVYQRGQDLDAADSDAAARGMFLSSIRDNSRSKVSMAAQRILDDLANQMSGATNDFNQQLSDATLDYQGGQRSIYGDANTRNYTNWLQNQQIPGASKTAMVFTLPQWLQYHQRAGTVLPKNQADVLKRYNDYVEARNKY